MKIKIQRSTTTSRDPIAHTVTAEMVRKSKLQSQNSPLAKLIREAINDAIDVAMNGGRGGEVYKQKGKRLVMARMHTIDEWTIMAYGQIL
jgi:hypothetical protein